MKKICVFLCLCLFLPNLAAAAGSGGRQPDRGYIMFQLGNGQSVQDGAVAAVLNSSGSGVSPYLGENGTPMLPLFPMADALGLTLSWNAEAKQAALSDGSGMVRYVCGTNEAFVNGRSVLFKDNIQIYNSSVFIPMDSLAYLDKVYYHRYSAEDGDFVLVGTGPLSDGDGMGDKNEPYRPEGNDRQLISFADLGEKLLGPSKASFESSCLVFRSKSNYALIRSEKQEIVSDQLSAAPYFTNGYLMVPLQFCASALGCTYVRYSNCCALIRSGVKYGYYFGENYVEKSGVPVQSERYYCEVTDGVVYVSASALSFATGLKTIFTSEAAGVVFTQYSGYDSLPDYSASLVSSLPEREAVPKAAGYIALTFDDGPSGAITERLLDGLKERGAHATFFLCNYRIAAYPDPMSRYLAEGHEIANHSATHSTMTAMSGTEIAKEIDTTDASIYGYTGTTPTLMRPPGGSYNDDVLEALAKRGMCAVIWSVDVQDWKVLNTKKVAAAILSTATDGDIVLLHDLYNTSVDAALLVVDALQARGFEFVTVSELAELKGYDLSPGGVYRSFK